MDDNYPPGFGILNDYGTGIFEDDKPSRYDPDVDYSDEPTDIEDDDS